MRVGRRKAGVVTFSSSLSWIDLIVLAVHSTTPRLRRAARSFSTVFQSSSELRSKTSVKTRLRMMTLKVALSVAFDCSSSEAGIVCMTSISPSPSIRASIGPTTVVLPPPISICLTSGLPLRTAETNSRISCTCAAREGTAECSPAARGTNIGAGWGGESSGCSPPAALAARCCA